MNRCPDHAREETPYIVAGDSLMIERGGSAGRWEVAQARYRDSSDRIELVLRRGSTAFKTVFNRETMRVVSHRPFDRLTRDVAAPARAAFTKRPRTP